MKKHIRLLAFFVLTLCLLCGCGSKGSSSEVKEYKTSMEKFFDSLKTVDENIDKINPEDQDAINLLFEQFDSMEKEFAAMAALTVPSSGVPETFAYIPELSKSASEYMTQANGYLHDSFSESSYNEHTLEAAMECYKRANKRVQFIITLLHGEYPKDESISFGN
ncbi:MAG: hypothetical protein IKZ39_08910 [Lachnospiraceae bacterium]|nr:hypothetical protein [Lachnospiraceae bacterium]